MRYRGCRTGLGRQSTQVIFLQRKWEPSLQVRRSRRSAEPYPGAAFGYGFPKGTIRSRRRVEDHLQGPSHPYLRDEWGTGYHGPRLFVLSLSRASSMTGHGKSPELLLVPFGTPSRSIRRRDAAILNQRGVE